MLKDKRKLVFMGGVMASILGFAAALVVWGGLPSSEWVVLAKWVGGIAITAFGVANSVEHLAKKR